MNSDRLSFPTLFKGIALFTPGGDLIYCIDPNKKGRWHLNLCAELQEILQLPEPPHFLVPSYTATIDRWLDPHTQQIKTAAEVYPLVQRYLPLLNAVFQTGDLHWDVAPWQPELGDPLVLETYRHQFPQLWEEHDLIVRFEEKGSQSRTQAHNQQGYVLRLFVSGHSSTTAQTLQNLHNLLERSLPYPYTLKIIDVFKHPEQAEANQISATPTLVRVWPQPVRRIVGELDNLEKVLQLLGITDT